MPVPEGVYNATFLFQTNASPRVLTTACGFIKTDLSTPTASEMALELYGVCTDEDNPMDNAEMIDDFFFLGVQVALGTPTGDILGQYLFTTQGTLSDSSPPSNCALIVAKNTTLGGRRNRGRFFWPMTMVNEGAIDAAGAINPAIIDNWQALFDHWLMDLETADIAPVLIHQTGDTTETPLISSFTVSPLLGTQRRRMRG